MPPSRTVGLLLGYRPQGRIQDFVMGGGGGAPSMDSNVIRGTQHYDNSLRLRIRLLGLLYIDNILYNYIKNTLI